MSRTPSPVIATCLVLCGAACYHPTVPGRTADTAARESFTLAHVMRVAAHENGTIILDDGTELSGDVAGTEDHILALPVNAIGASMIGGHYGVSDRLEFGLAIGYQEGLAEMRYGVLDEDAGHPLSAALSAATLYRWQRKAPGARVGLDLSRRFGSAAPFVGVYLSRGHELYEMGVPAELDSPSEFVGSRYSVVRDETRLTVPIGVSIRMGTKGSASISIAPYHTLAVHEARGNECGACVTDVQLEADTGGMFLVRLEFFAR